MPFDRGRYPLAWPEISRRVRDAAGQRCQWCGVPNGATGSRAPDGTFVPAATGSLRIVLTVAHLDHDPTNSGADNLRALCQRCHLRYDAQHHATNAARTRAWRKQLAGQLALPCLLPETVP